MMQAAIADGLEPDAARQLAVGTLHGAGALAHASDGDLARMRAGGHLQGGGPPRPHSASSPRRI